MKYIQNVGWDNGYDSEKIMTEVDKIETFPSIIHRPKSITNILYDNDYSFSKDKMILNYNDTDYFVGEYAIRQGSNGGIGNFGKDKFRDDSEVAKFLAGINLLENEDTVEIGNLILGLSIHTFSEYEEKLKEFYSDRTFRFTINGQEKKVIVDNVICIPQGIGAYYNQILTYSGEIKEDSLLNARYAMCDIGGNTVDAFIGEGIEPVNNTEIGLEIGLSDAFKSIEADIPHNIIQYNFLQGNDTIRHGTKKYENILTKCQKNFEIIAEDIYTQLIDQWNRQIDRVDTIVLAGGGAIVVGDYIKKLFINKNNKNVIVLDQPQQANVKGYYKLGVYHSQRLSNNE
jgi:hypothetical protein